MKLHTNEATFLKLAMRHLMIFMQHAVAGRRLQPDEVVVSDTLCSKWRKNPSLMMRRFRRSNWLVAAAAVQSVGKADHNSWSLHASSWKSQTDI